MSFKGTEEEFQAKVETTKTAASTEKERQARGGRDVVSKLCGKAEWEDDWNCPIVWPPCRPTDYGGLGL